MSIISGTKTVIYLSVLYCVSEAIFVKGFASVFCGYLLFAKLNLIVALRVFYLIKALELSAVLKLTFAVQCFNFNCNFKAFSLHENPRI